MKWSSPTVGFPVGESRSRAMGGSVHGSELSPLPTSRLSGSIDYIKPLLIIKNKINTDIKMSERNLWKFKRKLFINI